MSDEPIYSMLTGKPNVGDAAYCTQYEVGGPGCGGLCVNQHLGSTTLEPIGIQGFEMYYSLPGYFWNCNDGGIVAYMFEYYPEYTQSQCLGVYKSSIQYYVDTSKDPVESYAEGACATCVPVWNISGSFCLT